MKFKELSSFTSQELTEKLVELSKELIKDRAVSSTGTTPKSPAKIKNNRKTIARIHHLLSTKNLKGGRV